MDDTSFMGGFEGFGHLTGNGQGFIECNGSLRDPISECRPFDQFEHQRTDPISFLQTVDAGDVGMVQRGENLGFALEAGQAVGV